MKTICLLLFALCSFDIFAEESVCFGSTSDGRLENGVKLPYSGANFVSYSYAADLSGRTHVHSAVKEIIVASYKALELEQKGKIYKYAETGFKEGGQFRPHKTHRNGLSVDFMVSVVDEGGESRHLPTNIFNKLGYTIEFDAAGRYASYAIDYLAVAAHIVELHKQAKARGFNLWRVIFAPELQPFLFDTKYSSYLKKHIKFSQKASWVRHDEHYHVDFLVPCEELLHD